MVNIIIKVRMKSNYPSPSEVLVSSVDTFIAPSSIPSSLTYLRRYPCSRSLTPFSYPDYWTMNDVISRYDVISHNSDRIFAEVCIRWQAYSR